jgi:hypothetical protein
VALTSDVLPVPAGQFYFKNTVVKGCTTVVHPLTTGARVSDPDSHRVDGTSNVRAADLDSGGQKRPIKIEE